MLQVYPCLRECRLADVYTDLWLPIDESYVYMNMVTTVDGRATIDGKAYPIGDDADHYLMRRLRSFADAVIVGAGTVRNERVSVGMTEDMQHERIAAGKAANPRLVIVSGQGEVKLYKSLMELGKENLIIFGSNKSLLDLSDYASVHVSSHPYPKPEEVISTLRDRYGLIRLLLEGGPKLNAAFIESGSVDELFWTIAPKVIGKEGLPMVVPTSELPVKTKLQLVSLYVSDSEIFTRYKFVE